MSRPGGGAPRPSVALGVALAVVFSVAVVTLGVKTSTDGPGRSPIGVTPSDAAPAGKPGLRGPNAVAGRAQAAPHLADWDTKAAIAMNGVTLAASGVDLPEGANVFAARIFGGGPSPAYDFYEAGGGAFSESFYPASAVKLLAALGALDFVASLGFTGAVSIDGGATLRETYDAAIRWSSNEDYNQLVRVAGIDRLNLEFLPANGYTATAIQEAYGGYDGVAYSPAMVLTEGDREVEVPERVGLGPYGCDGSNCSSLFDLADAVRRVVLDAEIPAGERFAIAPADNAALQDALLGADAWITPGVQAALGPDALVYAKPGYVGGLDCVDDALVAAPSSGRRYLIALSVPDYEGCDLLATLAYDVIHVLDERSYGLALRTDGSLVPIVDGHQASR